MVHLARQHRVFPAALLLVCVFCASSARSAVLFKDSFQDGSFKPNSSDPKALYGYFFTPLNISVKVSYDNGLRQDVNPFSNFVPQTPITGAYDHIKMLINTNANWAPGKDKQLLRYTINVSAQTFGTEKHPFGTAVTRPNDDLRLAGCASISLDYATFIVGDWFITNEGVYAYYERLPFGRTATDNYHAFTQVKRVASRTPSDVHSLTTEYNAKAGVFNWYLGKKKVLSVSKLGFRLKEKRGVRTLVDQGGVEKVVKPASMTFGWGCFAILDAVDYWKKGSSKGLVQLNTGGYVTPKSWVDPASTDKSRNFGQGAKIYVKDVLIDAL